MGAEHTWVFYEDTMSKASQIAAACREDPKLKDNVAASNMHSALKYLTAFQKLGSDTGHDQIASILEKLKIDLEEIAGSISERLLTHCVEWWSIHLKKDMVIQKRALTMGISKCIALCNIDFDPIMKSLKEKKPNESDILRLLNSQSSQTLKIEAGSLREPRKVLGSVVNLVSTNLAKLYCGDSSIVSGTREFAESCSATLQSDDMSRIARTLGNLACLQSSFRPLQTNEVRHLLAKRCVFLLSQTDSFTMSAAEEVIEYLNSQVST
jgi:hypothetical protein